ncbi:MAG: DUF1934 domain-containing protein [Phascolarctobacterium sp.]|nr:DUF1934 domain-containing protein [Phascolarctobacterium sp.]
MVNGTTPVTIRVLSTTKDENGYQPTTEQKYTGQMLEKNGKYYVMYTDSGEESFAGTKTTIKWDQERVLILRSGALEHRQEFFKDLVDESTYKTPYLEIPLQTKTNYLYTYFRKGVWHIDLDYTLSHDGAVYGDMKILIEIEGVKS